MGALGGLYRSTPMGTMVIRLGVGPSHQSLWSSDSLPTIGARRLVVPAGWSWRQAASAARGSFQLRIAIVVMLMMRGWLEERGYSPAAWWEVTVATPHLIWLMVRGAPRKEWAECGEPASLGSDW